MFYPPVFTITAVMISKQWTDVLLQQQGAKVTAGTPDMCLSLMKNMECVENV